MLKHIGFLVDAIEEDESGYESKVQMLCELFEYEYAAANVVVVRQGDVADETNKFYITFLGSVMVTHDTNITSSGVTIPINGNTNNQQ